MVTSSTDTDFRLEVEPFTLTKRQAVDRVLSTFPIPGYLNGPKQNAVLAFEILADIALRYLPAGAQVLDFGCGPADKAALLQYMGMRCSGFDDWSDDWHASRRAEMEAFLRSSGVDFHHASEGWPFRPACLTWLWPCT